MIVTDWQAKARAMARRMGVRRAVDIARHKEPYRSEWISLGLARDLSVPFPAPAAKVPITVRPLRDEDWATLFDLDDPGISADERELRLHRLELARERTGSPFVAVTTEGEPCYLQWLFTPAENEQMRGFFNEVFPHLAPGEMLLEGAYTPEKHRGKGIMPCAMAQIADEAAARGARRVVTFVTEDNVPSLKGCAKAGFAPYIRRTVRWAGLRRTISFEGFGG
jgi:RimJ/RimL family protein N-acetyltransferase